MSQNKWIQHVKQFSKDNNIAYACAISDKRCKESYNKLPKISYKQKKENKKNQVINSIIYDLKEKIKYSDNSNKNLLKEKFNNLSEEAKNMFISKYKKYYDQLN